MEQVKMFEAERNSSLDKLAEEINAWLRKNQNFEPVSMKMRVSKSRRVFVSYRDKTANG